MQIDFYGFKITSIRMFKEGANVLMEFRVSTPAISGGAQRFRTVADELLNQISVVGREIEGLRGDWTGIAASQFDGLMSQWNSEAQNMTRVLEEVVQRLNQANASYEEVETSISKSFRQ